MTDGEHQALVRTIANLRYIYADLEKQVAKPTLRLRTLVNSLSFQIANLEKLT